METVRSFAEQTKSSKPLSFNFILKFILINIKYENINCIPRFLNYLSILKNGKIFNILYNK